MQLVFTDAVVENSISGSRWVGEGEKGYKVLFVLWMTKKKKEKKTATVMIVIV